MRKIGRIYRGRNTKPAEVEEKFPTTTLTRGTITTDKITTGGISLDSPSLRLAEELRNFTLAQLMEAREKEGRDRDAIYRRTDPSIEELNASMTRIRRIETEQRRRAYLSPKITVTLTDEAASAVDTYEIARIVETAREENIDRPRDGTLPYISAGEYSSTEGNFWNDPVYLAYASRVFHGEDARRWDLWRGMAVSTMIEDRRPVLGAVSGKRFERADDSDFAEFFERVLLQKNVVGPWALAVQRNDLAHSLAVSNIRIGKWRNSSTDNGDRQVKYMRATVAVGMREGGFRIWSMQARQVQDLRDGFRTELIAVRGVAS